MLFLLLVSVFAKFSPDAEWSQYLVKFGKNYTTQEEHDRRFLIFQSNLKLIEEHNAKNLPYTFGLTQFTDMTAYEFKVWVKRGNGGGYVPSLREKAKTVNDSSVSACGSSIDWVSQGAVTAVKNQGQCGSCWSFSTTGAIEGAYYVQSGKLVSLSEQELVDCDKVDQGCSGGLMDNAFKWVIGNEGLCSEVSYPYEAKREYLCKKSRCGTKYAPVKSYTDVPRDSTSALESAICKQPVAIAIEADQSVFQHYIGGVVTGSCGTHLDHGVLAVGFGSSGANDYWKVKNSWGASWGESGYIRLCRNCGANRGSGQCGLMMQASYPVL